MLISNRSELKFLICTDGVTCVVNDYELKNLLELEDINEISDKMKMLIEMHGAPDNYSYVLVTK